MRKGRQGGGKEGCEEGRKAKEEGRRDAREGGRGGPTCVTKC